MIEGGRDVGKEVVRTLEFYHAAEYFATVVRALAPEAEFKVAFAEAKWAMKGCDGFYIGSGTVESAYKSVVAARCKLAGMHWCLVTVAAVTIIRATLRSNLSIAV